MLRARPRLLFFTFVIIVALTRSCISQAHLGVRLKKDGYKVIGADWKRQEYFEDNEFCDEFHEVSCVCVCVCVCLCVGGAL